MSDPFFRKRGWVLALALGAALGACDDAVEPGGAPPPPPIPGQPALAQLVELRGAVTLERAGKASPAQVGALQVGDVLETGPSASATVRFPSGRTIELGPNARFKLGKDEDGLLLDLERGVLLSRVPAGPAGTGAQVAFRMLTPFGLTRVPAGAELELGVEDDGARVDVRVGSVDFLARDGERVTVTTGQPFFTKAPPQVLSPVEVKVFAGGGRIEVKLPGERGFKRVGRGGAALAAGAVVRAGAGNAALELGPQTRWLLGRNSQLVFGGLEANEDVEEAKATLERGQLSAQFTGKKKRRVQLGELEVSTDQDGSFSVLKAKDGYDVVAQAGVVDLTWQGASQKLLAGQRAELRRTGAKVDELGPDLLTLPTRHAQKVFHPGWPLATLTWDGEPGEYWVEVAADAGFTNKVLVGRTYQPRVTLPIPAYGSLFWRVAQAAAPEAWVSQGSASFAPEPRQSELARLRNEVPEGAERTTILFQDKPPAVTFTYASEPEATAYQIKVYRAGELKAPVVEKSVPATRAALEAGELSEGEYVWSVTPVSSKGEPLRGGKMTKLELVYDNSVSGLSVKAPRNGERVRGKRVEVVGVAPVGAQVSVNGAPIPLDGKARFHGEASVLGAPPAVVFTMVRPSSPRLVVLRVLRRGN